MKMDKRLLEILQHSLGLDKYGKAPRGFQGSTRNHFCAGGPDVELCRENVAMGYMQEHGSGEITGHDPLFTVTDAGRKAVREYSEVPPNLTRSQKRYRQFLDADSGESFGEWMKRQNVPLS